MISSDYPPSDVQVLVSPQGFYLGRVVLPKGCDPAVGGWQADSRHTPVYDTYNELIHALTRSNDQQWVYQLEGVATLPLWVDVVPSLSRKERIRCVQ